MTRQHRHAVSRRRNRMLSLLTAALVATALGFVSSSVHAGAAAGSPTAISAAASTDNTGLGGAVPTVLAAKGDAITLTVTLQPAGAAFNTDTTLALTPSLASGAKPGGSFTPTSVIMPAKVNSAVFHFSYSAVDNGVINTVSVAAKGKPSTITPGATAPFDVLKTLDKFDNSNGNLATGLGVGNNNCDQTTTESECGVLILPSGMTSSNGALSLGACTTAVGCNTAAQVVQFIGDLTGLYSTSAPATLIVRCDKALCRGKSVASYTLAVSFSATGALSQIAQPCIAKGVAQDASGNNFCIDYVQSHRDNSGDTLLYLLFVNDLRAGSP